MVSLPLLFLWVFAWLMPAETVLPAATMAEDEVIDLYHALELDGQLPLSAFKASYGRVAEVGGTCSIIAIADMTKPSTEKRLYVIDLDKGEVLLNTWVAHGQKSGDLMAEHFSNKHGSHQTSLGLYRVGERIISPKHGPALLLHGLDAGMNDQALAREVIMHGADYVSEAFILQHGRLGRSWGCPAVSRTDMARVVELLADGALLYIHGNQ